MGTHFKLRPKVCNDCGYSASGGEFVKNFGRFYYGQERCPLCKSYDISESVGLKGAPPPPPKPRKEKTKEQIHLKFLYDRLIHVHGENRNYDYMIKFKEIIDNLK